MLCRHFVYHVQLNCEPVVRGKIIQRSGKQRSLFCGDRGVWRRVRNWRWVQGELAEDIAAPARADRAIRGAQFRQKFSEQQLRSFSGTEQLVGFDVRVTLDEHVLENALLVRGQRSCDRRDAATAVAMTKPIDCQIVNDRDEPGREWASGVSHGRAAPQPGEVMLPQRLADVSEHIHHIVGFAGVATDRAKQQAAVALDEKVPRALGVASVQRSDPWFRHRPSGQPTNPDISHGSGGVNQRVETRRSATNW